MTGAGNGIGKAIAVLLTQQGAAVHLRDVNKEAIQSVATEIRSAGGTAVIHLSDVIDQAEMEAIFHAIGIVHILVNSAGISHIGAVKSTTEADFDRVCQVNYQRHLQRYTR